MKLGRILRGRVSRDKRLGPYALLENWGGLHSVVAYGSHEAMLKLQSQLSYSTIVRPVCRVCAKIKPIECKCEEEV